MATTRCCVMVRVTVLDPPTSAAWKAWALAAVVSVTVSVAVNVAK